MEVTKLSEFDISKVHFSNVEDVSFASTDFGPVNISIEYSNGELGPLVPKTDECFS